MSPEDTKRINRRRFVTGVVRSDKMDKTIVVETSYKHRHPVYQKVVRGHSKFKVHDEKNQAKAGDTVTIQECRRLSRDKRWILVKINDAPMSQEPASEVKQ